MKATMGDPIIRLESICKTFPLQVRQISLRHEASAVFRGWLRRRKRVNGGDLFYALEDVSFCIRRGEAVAVVGRNGSGKTTLLRIMARIMRPTTGRVAVEGRFAALIGLGAGFLPELTGRENIYLNASMHAVKLDDIKARLDEIIDFAELGNFIDQPIKNYSAGMSARLGFSIAIHTLPEMVFLDEVLAVGDEAFQEKCMARMLELKEKRKTIVFVSHSAAAVQTLCERALWLDQGVLIMDGPTDQVLSAYHERFLGTLA